MPGQSITRQHVNKNPGQNNPIDGLDKRGLSPNNLEVLQHMTENNNESKQSVFGKGRFKPTDGNKYLKFDNDNTVKYKFLEDEPVVSENKFGTEQYTFEVMNLDDKIVMSHSITSSRYMDALEDYTPLSGKSVCVHRMGEGMKTDYQVVLIG